MLKEIIISFQAYIQTHHFIQKNKLWKWIIIPGLVYTILLILGFKLFLSSYNDATQWLIEEMQLKKWIDSLENTWIGFLFIISKIFIDLLLVFAYFSFFKFFFLIIASPLFAYLSERTENLLTQKEHDTIHLSHWFTDIRRAIFVALKNMSWQSIYMVALIFISIIPIIGWVTPLICIFIDCYYLGFSMLDFSNAKNHFTSAESLDHISHHRGLAIGNGMIFYLFHLIPIIGSLLAPGYAVIAATLSIHQAKEKNIIPER